MKIEIPKITDLEEINNMAISVHELHVGFDPNLFKSVKDVITQEMLNEQIENEQIFVIRDDNKIFGYATISIRESKPENKMMKDRKILKIDSICINEDSRGKGIGTKLMDFFKEYAKENNCTDIYLTVNDKNKKAINFYEKQGMTKKSIIYKFNI